MLLKIKLFLFLGLLFPLTSYAQGPSGYDLGRCLSGYFEGIDLNDNGRLETVKVIEPCSFFLLRFVCLNFSFKVELNTLKNT